MRTPRVKWWTQLDSFGTVNFADATKLDEKTKKSLSEFQGQLLEPGSVSLHCRQSLLDMVVSSCCLYSTAD